MFKLQLWDFGLSLITSTIAVIFTARSLGALSPRSLKLNFHSQVSAKHLV